MKTTRILLLPLLSALFLPSGAAAQGTDNALVTDFGLRTTVGLDYKITKGLHLGAEYQLRTEDFSSKIDRHQATIGLSWKAADFLKIGAGYTFFYRQGSKAWDTRHRLYVDATLGWRAGDWRFSLKEQLRLTHKTEDLNAWQETRNPLVLKSRIKVQYKGFRRVEPYVFFEARNIFNDPACSAVWHSQSQSYSDYAFLGYQHAYFNRFRGALGVQWQISRHHGLDFYVMEDYCRDKRIDTNQEGTRLKSLTWDRSLNTIAGIAYLFSF
ncbi:MAG: DUF2490 domain-containing protein [Bacteroidales bacterium]|nr:DUF2490 domain-containing protein [Bacteroidales bacterium]